MEERRRCLRTELSAELVMNRLDQQSGEKVKIHITDVSKSGIGFICPEKLEHHAVYECHLTIWTKEVIQVFVEIVRESADESGGFHYGGSFIGMNDMDAYRIQVYQTVEQYKK